MTSSVLLASACGPKDHPAPSPETKTARGDEATTPNTSPSTSSGAANKASAPLALAMQIKVQGDSVGLSVSHAGTGTVSLSPDVVLERRTDRGFEVVKPNALTLRRDCASTGCVTLSPGGELLAPPWLGTADGERCGALISAQPAGEYRLGVSSCDKNARAEVNFTWPSP